jgi:hypothetical protein
MGQQLESEKNVVQSGTSPVSADDSASLARKLANSFGGMLRYYQEQYKLNPQEAHARASEPYPLEQVTNGTEDQVSWFGLQALAAKDPELARQRWEEVKKAALDELRTGYHASRLLEDTEMMCWGRAKFLAIRTCLIEAWRPRDAQELHLIDQMATYQTLVERWQELFAAITSVADTYVRKRKSEMGKMPRVADVEAIQVATSMIERLQKLYHLALNALQSQRRLCGSALIRHANQVNLGNGIQIQVSSPCED